MSADVQRLTLPVATAAGGEVAAVRYATGPPGRAPVLLVPGAGGSLDSEPLVALCELVAACGHPVLRANLPHHQDGRRAPRAETAVAGFRELVAAAGPALGVAPGEPLVLGGRSYGSRVASLAIAAGEPAAGLLCSGYPLHPPGRPEELRVGHWPKVDAPCLFLQGDHDPFADLELLRRHRRKLPRRSDLEVVIGGDHSLRVTAVRSDDGVSRSPTAALEVVRDAVCAWLAER